MPGLQDLVVEHLLFASELPDLVAVLLLVLELHDLVAVPESCGREAVGPDKCAAQLSSMRIL